MPTVPNFNLRFVFCNRRTVHGEGDLSQAVCADGIGKEANVLAIRSPNGHGSRELYRCLSVPLPSRKLALYHRCRRCRWYLNRTSTATIGLTLATDIEIDKKKSLQKPLPGMWPTALRVSSWPRGLMVREMRGVMYCISLCSGLHIPLLCSTWSLDVHSFQDDVDNRPSCTDCTFLTAHLSLQDEDG